MKRLTRPNTMLSYNLRDEIARRFDLQLALHLSKLKERPLNNQAASQVRNEMKVGTRSVAQEVALTFYNRVDISEILEMFKVPES